MQENNPPFAGAGPEAAPTNQPLQGSAAQVGGRFDLITIVQLAVSGLGVVLALLASGFIGVMGLVMLFSEASEPERPAAMFMLSAVGLFAAFISTGSLVFSLQRPLGRVLLPSLTTRQVNSLRIASLLLLIWPLVLVVGNLVWQRSFMEWLLLPPLLLLAAGIPGWWLIEMARRGLPAGSRQRGWGMVNFSIFISTPLMMFIEIAAALVVVMFLVLWLSLHPDATDYLQRIMQQITTSQQDPEAIIRLAAPFLRNPWVIFGVISITAGVVPLIEELVKPLAVWLLVGKKPSAAEGFVAGALCGAGFGIIESMLYLSNPAGESWAFLAAGRAGTIMLHITTTALVGWAMASAWRRGGYAQLGGVYLLAVALHGLWNGLAVLTGFSMALETATGNLRLLYELSRIAPFGILALAAGIFGLLLWSNHFLRRQIMQVALPAEPAGETRHIPS